MKTEHTFVIPSDKNIEDWVNDKELALGNHLAIDSFIVRDFILPLRNCASDLLRERDELRLKLHAAIIHSDELLEALDKMTASLREKMLESHGVLETAALLISKAKGQ